MPGGHVVLFLVHGSPNCLWCHARIRAQRLPLSSSSSEQWHTFSPCSRQRRDVSEGWSLGDVKFDFGVTEICAFLRDAVSRHSFADAQVGMSAARVLCLT